MKLEDLTRDDFEPNHLSDEDGVRFRFAEAAYAAGDAGLAARILSGDADDYAPMRWSLFLANHDEHGSEYLAEWDRLTRQSPATKLEMR
jgi:hypothetical protein